MDGRNIFQNGKLCATLLVKNLNPTVYLRLNHRRLTLLLVGCFSFYLRFIFAKLNQLSVTIGFILVSKIYKTNFMKNNILFS